MKKGDTDELAEHHMKDNHRGPGWMCAARPQSETETTEHRGDQADEIRLPTINYLSHCPAGDGVAAWVIL